MKLSPNGLHEALALLGEYLDGRALRYDLVIVGGGALLLQGLSRRATADLDVVARFGAEGLTRAQPLPEPLVRAVRDVGRALGLADDWLNDGPEDLLRLGLPPGFEERMVQQIYGGLTLRLAHRRDLIALKLCAAADRGAGDPETFDKHLADLRVLAPTRGEIADGVRWARTQSGGEVFEAELAALVRRLEASEHG